VRQHFTGREGVEPAEGEDPVGEPVGAQVEDRERRLEWSHMDGGLAEQRVRAAPRMLVVVIESRHQ